MALLSHDRCRSSKSQAIFRHPPSLSFLNSIYGVVLHGAVSIPPIWPAAAWSGLD
jgi:hypothetical protein